MNAAIEPIKNPGRDLTNLAEVQLDPRNEQLFGRARATASGAPEWLARKQAETRELLAHSQLTGRYQIEWLDLRVDLRAVFVMHAPVPCLPNPAGPLRIASAARIGFVYSEEAARWPTPGTAFAQILGPAHVWLPNAFADSQTLCLGNVLPAGVRATEVVHLIFRALTLQSVQMDLLDSSGVANREAALWWQRNIGKLPLTREGFTRESEAQP